MARLSLVSNRTRDRVTPMSHRLVMLVGICTWLVGWGAGSFAHGAERLVVPFSCHAHAGGVTARPSHLQNYAVIGEREAAPFTACASDGSDRCRTMILHRFDIDCGGVRVGWPEFYAAISDVTTRRAYIEDDRLLVRVPPQRRRGEVRSRFQPSPSRRPFLVEMPDGFAPVRGTVARFEGQRGPHNSRMQATRDPFNAPQQRTFASREPVPPVPSVPVRESQNSSAIAKPIQRPSDLEPKRNVIAVPKVDSEPKVQTQTPTVTKRPVVKTEPVKTQTKEVAKPEKPPVQPSPKLKVVKAPPSKPTSNEPVSSEQSKNVVEAPAAPVVPTLLNGPKEKKAPVVSNKPAPSENNKLKDADQSRTIADILQNRGEDLRAKSKIASSQGTKPETTAVKNTTGDTQRATGFHEPAASPSLANTLAVLGVVAGLLLTLSFAAYRLLTPKPAPRIQAPRLTKSEIRETPSLAFKEPSLAAPSLAAMAQATVTRPENVQKTNEANSKTDFKLESQVPAKPEPTLDDKRPNPRPKPTLAIPSVPASEVISPKLNVANARIASDGHDKPQPSLSLKLTDKEPPADKLQPELPMPKLVADKIKKPDFDESALLLPKTRQEALSALGVGESAGDEVIERVVAGLRQCWRPDDSTDKAERERRLQRMQQIETAWRILSEPSSVADEHAKQRPN